MRSPRNFEQSLKGNGAFAAPFFVAKRHSRVYDEAGGRRAEIRADSGPNSGPSSAARSKSRGKTERRKCLFFRVLFADASRLGKRAFASQAEEAGSIPVPCFSYAKPYKSSVSDIPIFHAWRLFLGFWTEFWTGRQNPVGITGERLGVDPLVQMSIVMLHRFN